MIFAFFGYNESFAGEAGLPKFKEDLDDVHQAHAGAEVQRQVRPAARAVLADRASRTTRPRTCPTASANNKRLELYTTAMAEVAKANGVPFVDLFTPDAGRCTRRRRSR